MTIMAADDDDVQLSLSLSLSERKGKEKPTISFSVLLFAVCDSAAPCRANRKQNN